MSKDNAYLEDMLEAAKAIQRFTTGVSREATTFGQKNGFGKLVESSGGKCVFGKCGTAIFRSEKHARIQVWFITDGTDYILATHICSTEPDPTEVGEVKEIVSMLTLGPEKPSTSAN
ncbi:MAG: hypothetical protein U1F83_18125 [Verrucomicrobiota bacterium]